MFSVTKTGFDEMLKKLNGFSNLESKIANVMEELCEIGSEVIITAYSDTTGSGSTANSVKWDKINETTYEISAESEALLFLEFGAGVSPRTGFSEYTGERPTGISNIGEYGLGKGKQEKWSYVGKDGKTHTTTGTRARSAFPQAVDAILQAVPGLLKGVF